MGPSETDVIDRLVRWAGEAAQVRALLLTSSRADPDAPVDELSDYDVVVIVPDARAFDAEETWFHEYGQPLVSFQDERVRSGLETRTRLVVYEDGTKVDYQVWPVDLIKTLPKQSRLPSNLDVGYRVLLDKDGLTSHLPRPTYAAHIPARPTETEFLALVEEFWWETTYVAKNLWRDELLPAKYSFDAVIRFDLMRRMLEWHVEFDHDWSIRPGAAGRWLKARLDPDLWTAFESTFAGAKIEENWEALFRATALFREVSRSVGSRLGFCYPEDLDERVMRYLVDVRELER